MKPLIEQFVETDGAELARVALEDLARKYREALTLLWTAVERKSLPLTEGRLLIRYGLAIQKGPDALVSSQMVRRALIMVPATESLSAPEPVEQAKDPAASSLRLETNEWAEELAMINRRRNVLERKLREFVRVVLKVSLPAAQSWTEEVLKATSAKRRTELIGLASDALLAKLYWLELEGIVSKHWQFFEQTLGDKKRFQGAMGLVNERPDAHAKQVDAADLALYRRELTWLEERVA